MLNFKNNFKVKYKIIFKNIKINRFSFKPLENNMKMLKNIASAIFSKNNKIKLLAKVPHPFIIL